MFLKYKLQTEIMYPLIWLPKLSKLKSANGYNIKVEYLNYK